MFLLILSLLALFVGCAIFPVIRKFPAMLSFFDAFVLISIVGLTMMHLIPHSVENAGIPGVIAVAVGLGVPALLHKFQHHHAHEPHHDHLEHHDHKEISQEHHHENEDHDSKAPHNKKPKDSGIWLLIIVFIGLLIHTLLDGIGLSMSSIDDEVSKMLGLGVLFHRLPVGIFLSMMLAPRIGLKKTWGVILALATATCIGFALGHYALPSAGLFILNLVQGLIAGTLLHVVFHNMAIEGRQESRYSKGIGAFVGFLTLAIVEWIAPVHAHAHASILDIWVDYLCQAAPVWCILAVLLGATYGLSRKSGRLSSIAQSINRWIDPQPTPAAFGGISHCFSAAGIVVLFSLWSLPAAGSWWIPTAVASLLSMALLKSIACCNACRPDSLCEREKSFAIWTASSWTLIAVMTLLASVIPEVIAPITEIVESLPEWAAILTLILTIAAIFTGATRKRSVTIHVVPIILFALFAVFHKVEWSLPVIAAAGCLLIFMYDFHPRDMENAIDNDHPWHPRYALTAAICLALASAPAVIYELEDAHEIQLTRQEFHHHEHHHEHAHELDTAHHDHEDAHHEHLHEVELAHEEAEHHHDHELEHHDAHHDEDAHHHDRNIERDHDETDHDHDAEHALTGRMKVLDNMHHHILSFIAFVLFILNGLFWMLRLGPRHLFEMIHGKHHHQHG